MTSWDLFAVYKRHLEDAGRYVFHPVPLIIRGASVRLSGDGPASWSVWCVIARPKSGDANKWGALPGAYITTRGAEDMIDSDLLGRKTVKSMSALVRDYSREGDIVCDPCAGSGTTWVAAGCATTGWWPG